MLELINAVSNSGVPSITGKLLNFFLLISLVIVGASYGAGNYAMSGNIY